MAPNFKTREISPKRRRTPPGRRYERSLPLRKTKYTCKKERENHGSWRSREVKERERYKRKIDYRSGSKGSRRELCTYDEKSDRKCSYDNSFYREQRYRRSSSNGHFRRRTGNDRSGDRDNIKTDFTRKRGGSCEKSSSSSSSIERTCSTARDRFSTPKEFYESQNPVISIPARAPLVPVVRRILLPPMPPRPLIKPHIIPGQCLRVPCPPRALRPIIRPVIKVVTPYVAARHLVMPFRPPVAPSGSQLNFTLPSVQYVMQ